MNPVIESIRSTRLTDEQVGLWFLGQEGFLFKYREKYLLIDPYLSDYVDRFSACKGLDWKRLYPAPVDGEELDFVDAVLCTHAHDDHMDPFTLPKLVKASPKAVFVAPAPTVEHMASLGVPKERIMAAHGDQPMELAGFKISSIPSAHEDLHLDEHGDYRELGYILEAGVRIFHAGDMCMYPGLIQRLENLDAALLPINGRDYFRQEKGVVGNFDCVEAVTLAKKAGVGLLVPMHHDLYAVNGVSPVCFVETLMKLNPGQRYHLFAPGERYILQR